jgi:hypothetical protein
MTAHLKEGIRVADKKIDKTTAVNRTRYIVTFPKKKVYPT